MILSQGDKQCHNILSHINIRRIVPNISIAPRYERSRRVRGFASC
jgi:hypothetical protein